MIKQNAWTKRDTFGNVTRDGQLCGRQAGWFYPERKDVSDTALSTQSNLAPRASRRWIVMGVSGVGKSEIGTRLALRLGVTYIEGDDYHTPGSVAKMARGVPLDDVDRLEWLRSLRSCIGAAREREQSMVLTCSALKRRYRNCLREADPHLVFIHLVGESALIASRMRDRPDHFMPPMLLESQFRDLEPPLQDENAISLDIRKTPDQIVSEILQNAR